MGALTFRAIEPAEEEAFNAYLEEAGADFLQTTHWGRVKASFGWVGHHIVAEEGGRWIGAATLLERRLIGPLSLLYVPRGPQLPARPEVWEAFANCCRRLGRGRAVAVKVDPDVPKQDEQVARCLQATGFFPAARRGVFGGIQPRVISKVDLTDEPVFRNFKAKTRYNIRLAKRRGVSVRKLEKDEVSLFYALLAATARRQRFAIRPKIYYDTVFSELNERGLATLLLAESPEGAPLAANWVAHFGTRAWYLYGASSDTLKQLMGSYLVQWEAMMLARQLGCRTYDLCGVPVSVDPAGEAWGIYRFKRNFTSQFVELAGEYDFPLRPWLHRAACALEQDATVWLRWVARARTWARRARGPRLEPEMET